VSRGAAFEVIRHWLREAVARSTLADENESRDWRIWSDISAVIDSTTGEILTAELFVAVLGASSLTYAEATWTQSLPDWIGPHKRAFSYFGGVTAMIVSDNLKSGITKACCYEPNVNRTYQEMADHYDSAIVPARR
jgi:transposase